MSVPRRTGTIDAGASKRSLNECCRPRELARAWSASGSRIHRRKQDGVQAAYARMATHAIDAFAARISVHRVSGRSMRHARGRCSNSTGHTDGRVACQSEPHGGKSVGSHSYLRRKGNDLPLRQSAHACEEHRANASGRYLQTARGWLGTRIGRVIPGNNRLAPLPGNDGADRQSLLGETVVFRPCTSSCAQVSSDGTVLF
jgi:hypothetical protein